MRYEEIHRQVFAIHQLVHLRSYCRRHVVRVLVEVILREML